MSTTSDEQDERTGSTSGSAQRGKPWPAVVLAWLFPGVGYLYLGRRGRALFFGAIVLACFLLGFFLDGKLFTTFDAPFTGLRTLASMSVGLPYFVLRFVLGYEGDVRSVGFEYGSTFLITAGLMNLLLIFDSWDVARGIDRNSTTDGDS